MTRRLISSGSSFEAKIGYSRAVIDGDWAFVAGTTGFDYKAGTLPDDVVAQCENTFKNISAALEQAGFSLADVVRATYYLPDRADFEPCWPVMQKYFGNVRPAATMLVAGLLDPRMKIEIEVTAKLKKS
jgi:enamine deaminase RidA (YjgF/YER057c/UK114 family)